MKNLFKNLLVLSLSLIFVFVLAEIGMRLFWTEGDNFYQKDELIGMIHIPNKEGIVRSKEYAHKIKINSHGFLDKERSYQKEEGVYRIVFLGDSMAESIQVPIENNFINLSESALSEKGKKAEAINLGVKSFGTARAYLTLKHYGLEYQPDLAVLVFTLGNDFLDNYSEDENSPSFVSNQDSASKNKIKSFLVNHSKLVSYLKSKFYSSIALRNFLVKVGVFSQSKQVKDLEGIPEQFESIPRDYLIYSSDYPDFLDQGWQKTKYFLDKFKQLTQEKEIELLVILLPTQDQIYEQIWQETQETYPGLKGQEWDLTKPNRILKEYFEQNEIAYLDLYPSLKEAQANISQRLFFKYDGHFTEAAHQQVQQVLTEYLLENYLDLEPDLSADR